MSALDELYREVILEHYKSPHNRGRLVPADVANRGHNPLCGDEVEVSVHLADGRIEDIRFQGRGCSISQASASMMTDAVKGKSVGVARELIQEFKQMMKGEAEPGERLGDVEALQGVRKYPVRVKCALLSWTTLEEGLERFQSSDGQRTDVGGGG